MNEIAYDIFRNYGRYHESIKERMHRPKGPKFLYAYSNYHNEREFYSKELL